MRTDLYATSIVLCHAYAGGGRHGWWAVLHWQGGRFADAAIKPAFLEGEARNRYGLPTPAEAVFEVLEIARALRLSRSPSPLVVMYDDAPEAAADKPADADAVCAELERVVNAEWPEPARDN